MKSVNHIIDQHLSSRLFEGNFGFEKENIRVDKSGHIALTPHPEKLGDKLTHPYITTDFSESQIEMITPIRPSVKEALGFLETIHDIVTLNLDNDELLWPQSTPPLLPEDEAKINIAHFGEKGIENEKYREHLANTYGKKKQLLSGIHFNFSFPEKALEHYYKTSEKNISYDKFKEEIYLRITRNFLKDRWFLIALLGNSPVLHNTYNKSCIDELPKATSDAHHFCDATSMRSSMCGYKNNIDLILDYSSIENYKKSIKSWIDKGVISSEKENYSTLRLKEINGKLSHIEVRLLDLDPLVKCGINPLNAEIIHIFLIYCLLKDEEGISDEEQTEAHFNQEIAAEQGMSMTADLKIDGKKVNLQREIMLKYRAIEKTVEDILPQKYMASLEHLRNLSDHLKHRPAYRVLEGIKETTFLEFHLQQAKQYYKESNDQNYKFFGLEDMELSTQLLLREAVFRGVNFEIMDRPENFVRLEKEGHIEHVMQATRTSLDNYVSVLMMENKVMTKKLLEAANIRTPKGEQYSDVIKAKEDFMFFKGKAIVIKPKSTNFGLGITIIKENKNEEFYHRAIQMAFEHDNSILIEEFVTGKEYRIFIIKDEVVGILHRVPANVKGDGENTIRELVIEKNKDPLRGKGYKTPLEKIALGEAEEMFLETQGYSFSTVPDKDQIIYLRENSNISTGGDSLDFTDDIPDSYKKIAVDAAKALNVEITGLDMMIDDIKEEANVNNYAIIEMNFNPAIHIHCHPYKGKNRKLNAKVMDALGY
ncbi:bifunctional glutamate--cysteine ligase GshA/glutathione synthetase GshB [Flammeovirga sp. SubArs3]|uniref:bifunctional glutamate--cysteine ligase GshA/glutathione synthetase GshB n=1 Tax=Flammeovirga sp. SubArs3 TaxID=2995316 RepID=UPI00248BEF8F|nr:bifunctional glutamate--cysteine ligase GshA/glutathione synthetase GshB [Flammeovirga sp. SubArs3]